MTGSISEINELLDGLYIELLHLIEQQTQCRINIESTSKSGQLLLAKTRYAQGSNAIGIAQIPAENSTDFNALCRILDEINETSVAGKEFRLEKYAIDKEKNFVDPMQWFGVLPSSTLRLASENFKKCIQLTVESANIQREMLAVMNNIERLKEILGAREN